MTMYRKTCLPLRALSFSVLAAALSAAALSGTAGCMTQAEQSAKDGLTAFQNCDLRTAANSFSDAHTLDPSRPDFALAYALSTLAVLPEEPAVTAVLERLGFDGPIDTSMFWGSGGILAQLSSPSGTATCQSVQDYFDAHFPYAPARKDGPTAASVLHDPALDGDAFVAAAAALDPRLQKLVDALEQAAANTSGFDITGGCGVGSLHIQTPELYALAAFIEAVRATIAVAQGYDWAVPASLALDTSGNEPAWVDALNAHVFHLKSAGSVAAASPMAQHAALLLGRAATAASTISSRPANSLFDWSKVPAGVVSDVQQLAASAQQMLAAPGTIALPFVTPQLAVDGQSFFAMPVDLTGVQPPLWVATPWTSGTQHGYSVDTQSSGAEMLLAPRFSPDPFGSSAPSFTFSLSDNSWKDITSDQWLAAFDPDRRWDHLYQCQ
jgi:hypothetical protein